MGPWFYILIFAVAAVVIVLVLSLVFSLIVAAAGRRFSQSTLEKYETRVENLLPGKNCGECGYDTCEDCAAALLRAARDDDICPYTSEEDRAGIAQIREELKKLMDDPAGKKYREKKRKSFFDRKF